MALGSEAVAKSVILLAQEGIDVDSRANSMRRKSLKSPLEMLIRARKDAFEVWSFRPHRTMLAPSPGSVMVTTRPLPDRGLRLGNTRSRDLWRSSTLALTRTSASVSPFNLQSKIAITAKPHMTRALTNSVPGGRRSGFAVPDSDETL